MESQRKKEDRKMELNTTGMKVSDMVKEQIKTAKKAKGSELTQEELTKACLTPKDRIDENGIFMGDDYDKFQKRVARTKHTEEEIERLKNMYQYDPVKERMMIRVYFTDKLLAVAPGDPEMQSSYLASLSMDAVTRDEEIMIAGLQEVINKGRERFEVVRGKLVWDARRWMAYIRDRANCISNVSDSKTSDASNLKNNVLNRISFAHRFFPITLPKDKGIEIGLFDETNPNKPEFLDSVKNEKDVNKMIIDHLDRSMPGDGYKRDTSLKSSEFAPIGSTTYFVIQIENRCVCGKEKDKKVETREVIREALNNGTTKGTGGWRGSGMYGKFLWEELDENGKVIDGNTMLKLGTTSNEPDFREKFYDYANNCIMADEEHAELEEFAL